jgi:hypothetical protein
MSEFENGYPKKVTGRREESRGGQNGRRLRFKRFGARFARGDRAGFAIGRLLEGGARAAIWRGSDRAAANPAPEG